MDRVTEDDLLALIEGELPEHRKPIVEAALRADPALVERVRRLIADRQALQDLARTDKAPTGLVPGALARADRTRLIQVDTGAPVRQASLARGSRVRRTQMAVAAVLLIGALGIWAWLMAIVSQTSRERADAAPPHRTVVRADAEGNPIAEQAEGPKAPEDTEIGPSVAEAMDTIGGDAPPQSAAQADNALLHEWLANLDQQPPEQPTTGETDWHEAARLALAGKLRIDVEGAGPLSVALADSGEGAARALKNQLLRQGSGADERWRIEVPFRDAVGEQDLAAQLETLVLRLQARTGRRVWVSEANAVDLDATPAPALEVADIFWWTQGPDAWTRHSAVRLPVEFVTNQ